MTLGNVGVEIDVAFDCDRFVKGIDRVRFRVIANDVDAAVSDLPSLEVPRGFIGRMGHFDGVALLIAGCVRAEDHALLAQHNIFLIEVGDRIGFEQHGVVGDGNAGPAASRVQLTSNLGSDIRDSLRGSLGCIVRNVRPAAEEHARIQIFNDRIVDDLVQVVDVAFFDVYGSDLAVVLTDEFDRQGIFDNSVDREGAGLESGRAAVDLGFHLLDIAAVVQVGDPGGLADRVGGEDHLDRSQRLNLIAVRVDEGDVDCGHVPCRCPDALRDLLQHGGIVDRGEHHLDLLVEGAGLGDHVHGDAGGLAGEEGNGHRPRCSFFDRRKPGII